MNRDAAGRKRDASTDALSQASPDYVPRSSARIAAALIVLVLGAGAFAAEADRANIYQDYTDEELSEIASDWQSLTTEERRDFSIEIHHRMAQAGKKLAVPPARIVEERRFGRIIRQPDGSVLRIEGVVRYRGNKTDQADQTETPPDYGTGFEQRVGQAADQRPAPAVTAPVIPVGNGNGVGQTEVVADEDDPETTTDGHGESARGRD